MRPNPNRTLGARLLIAAALNCCTPLLADTAIHADAEQQTGHVEQPGWRGSAVRRQFGNPVLCRTNPLDSSEPRFVRARACLFVLLQDGYDSQLLDYWLEALGEDTIIEGMPGDLVVAFYGEPLDRKAVTFEGSPAELWSIVRRPDRADKIVIMSGKVVRIGA